MSVSVGVIIKKVAAAVLGSDKETKKKFGTFIATATGVLFLPVLLVAAVFSDMDSHENSFVRLKEELMAVESQRIELVDTTGAAIYSTMLSNGFTMQQAEEAENIYWVFYINNSSDEDFVNVFVGCFSPDQTAETLCVNLNSTFGTTLTPDNITYVLNSVSVVYIDTDDYIDTTTKNNFDLVTWAINAEANHWGYVWGTSGTVLTQDALDSLAETFPDNVGAPKYYDFIKDNWIGRRTADCAGLIKGYLWLNPETHEVEYGSNGFSDGTSDDLFNSSTENGTMDTMPDIPGICVWHEGHVGIYIGNDTVIEAMGTEKGVVRTTLSTDSRWTNWFMMPGMTYWETVPEPTPEPTEASDPSAEPTEVTPSETEETTTTESEEN